jgi:SAM-dependent methyltransferase
VHGPADVLRVLTGAPGKRLFEGGCGTGKLSRALAERGFEVTASTFGAALDLGPGIRCLAHIDLNLPLPIADAAFDCAVLQEVIEHLENPAHVVREFSRILRPGGLWVLTTPNASNVRSHYLLWQYGFRVRALGRSNRKLSTRVLCALLYPFLWVGTMRYARPMAKYDSALQREACRNLRRLLLSPAVLLNENLVLVLTKSGPAADYAPRPTT